MYPLNAAQPRKKRNRVQLSCTACRTRKLKCCRTHPCTNCKRRDEEDSCTFVGPGPRKGNSQTRADPSHVQDRLQHLENLVLSFAQKKRLEEGQQVNFGEEPNTTSAESSSQVFLPTPGSSLDEGVEEPPLDPNGKLIVKDTGTSYIDGAHWRAMLEEINEVKLFIQEENDASEDESIEQDPPKPASPTLLLGVAETPNLDELLADIPPRPVLDRVVSQFLTTKEPCLIIIHLPTFQKEYNQFWSNPKEVSIPWLALLHAILTVAVSLHRRNEVPLPNALGDPYEAITRFHERTAQYLIKSNYTLPGKYKVEALFLHSLGEFYKSDDAQLGVSFLLGITIRLAMAMGYHRDQRYYSSISAFEGEMRRRRWALMCQMDSLMSFQLGFPKTIQSWQFDTKPPNNLLDEDFSEDLEQLPQPRPETERTPSSYTRSKGRIMSVFGKISDLAYSRKPVTYEETLELDRQLEEAHDLLPSFFQMRSMADSIVDSPDLIFRRYTMELLYQKGRCVLHRRYLAKARSNLRYAYSQWACLSAAKETLRHQADLYHESQPGGQLYRHRQYVNALQYADFLLGAMIICLELYYDCPDTGSGRGNITTLIHGREDLLSALETSHNIFGQWRRESADSQKAYAALTIMLRRARGAGNPEPDMNIMENLSPFNDPQLMDYSNILSGSNGTFGDIHPTEPSFGSLSMIEEVLNAPTEFDWRLWDRQMQ